MNKTFLFDMDGVIVDSERSWVAHDTQILGRLFDERIRNYIGNTTGIGVRGIHDRARAAGSDINFGELEKVYEVAAMDTYDRAPITPGVEDLAAKLISWKFKLALVTSSPKRWIDRVVPRLSFADKFDCIVSLADRRDLKPKPAPDGYAFAMQTLGVDPRNGIVLEDSNSGIASGKSAGAYVIGYTGNLYEGYEQSGSDDTAASMDDVITLVEKFLTR